MISDPGVGYKQSCKYLESQWPVIMGCFGSFMGYFEAIVAYCFRLLGVPGRVSLVWIV